MNWYKRAKKERKCSGWLAVRLNEQVAGRIKEWGKGNIPDDILCKAENKGRETDTHITIVYGICAEEIEIIKAVLKDQRTIKAKLGDIGFFDKSEDGHNPLIIKVESKDLEEVNKKVNRVLNIESSYSEYKPHCTIAYLKPGEAAKYAGDKEFSGTELSLNKVVFVNENDEETEFLLKSER